MISALQTVKGEKTVPTSLCKRDKRNDRSPLTLARVTVCLFLSYDSPTSSPLSPRRSPRAGIVLNTQCIRVDPTQFKRTGPSTLWLMGSDEFNNLKVFQGIPLLLLHRGCDEVTEIEDFLKYIFLGKTSRVPPACVLFPVLSILDGHF